MNVVIIGNGICGITAAKFITEFSPKDKISIFTDEPYHYYPRPLLDKLLSEKIDLSQLFPYSGEWFKRRNIEVFLNSKIKAIDASRKELIAEDSTRYNYDRLLLSYGSSPFVPPIEGAKNEEVFTYRNINDVLTIRSYARGKKKAVVIGGGLLGLETARALVDLGLKVTVIEYASRLLPKQLDEESAEILKSQIERLKIEVILNTTCTKFITEGGKSCLLSKEIGKVEADLIIISAGVRPSIELPKSSGIEVNKGVVVDKNLRTNCADIYAAGDCAEFNGVVYGIIPAAIDQGRAAASNIIDKPFEYKGTTFQTTLKVLGVDLTSIGVVNPEGEDYEQIKTKDLSKGIYRKIITKDGRLVGAIILGEKRGVAELTKIIETGIDVSRNKDALLGDEDILRQTFFKN